MSKRQKRFIDNMGAAYDKGRKFGYQEGVYATHAIWIAVMKDTPGIGPKTQEKFLTAARAMMANRLKERGNLNEISSDS